MIRCDSCGCQYDPEEEEYCPKCGAQNPQTFEADFINDEDLNEQ